MGRIERGGGDVGEPVRSPLGWPLYGLPHGLTISSKPSVRECAVALALIPAAPAAHPA